MSIRINTLSISNLRNIPFNKKFKIDITGKNMTILDGPNGYGKSTIFDAIELLITGNIKHFFDRTYNVGTEPLKSVANNDSYSTVICASIIENDIEKIVCRVFDWDDNNSSFFVSSNEIENSQIFVDQNEIYNFFGLSENVFHLGMYISQAGALNFLEQPYKKRKDSLSTIMGTENVELIISQLTSTKNALRSLKKVENDKLQVSIDQLENERLKSVENIREQKDIVDYFRLFPEKNYIFDMQFVELSKKKEVLSELEKIEKLIVHRNEIRKEITRNRARKIEGFPQTTFKAIFFKSYISEIKENLQYYVALNEIPEYLDRLKKEGYNSKNDFLESEFREEFRRVTEINNEIRNNETLLTQNQKAINNYETKRSELFDAHRTQHILSDNNCPFCGKTDDNLEELYNQLTEVIKGHNNGTMTRLTKLKADRDRLFKEKIIPQIENLLTSNSQKLEWYQYLQDVLYVEKKYLLEEISGLNIMDNSETEDFIEFYNRIMERTRKIQQENTANITNFELDQIKLTADTYFANHQITISTEDVINKRRYIVNQFSEESKHDRVRIDKTISDIKAKQAKLNLQCDIKMEMIEDLKEVYRRSLINYQNNFLDGIIIALKIISGRILQTTPIGLGINTDVSNRKIEFKIQDIDHDVYNMLSSGQLNGLMISILLAVRKTFLTDKKIDLLLIDDPLQTIDDLSAHSFVDLLVQEFSDLQIVMSTHEKEKMSLFAYKFNRAKIPFNNINLQEKFLEMK